jgi:lipopolysaccharide/colanic/teichoic acid biosynthesis glycosyltransferase
MRIFTQLLERIAASLLLVASLPMLLLTAVLIYQTAGRPVIVTGELPGSEGIPSRRRLHFRTTGRGPSFFQAFGRFLRANSIDELPGLWNVVVGDIRLSDALRFMLKR